MSYQPRKTRIIEHEEQKMIRRILIAGTATIFLLGLIFFGGVKALASLGALLNQLKGDTGVTQNANNFLIAPRIEPLDNATNSAKIMVRVDGQKDSSIELFVNDQSSGEEKVTDQNNATFSAVFLKEGTNSLYAVAKDSTGKTSQPSTKQQVVYDATAPKLDVTTPQDNQIFSDTQEIKISGKTEVSAALTINDLPVNVNQDGTFSQTIQFDKGDKTITVVATDSAGNQTKVERKFSIH